MSCISSKNGSVCFRCAIESLSAAKRSLYHLTRLQASFTFHLLIAVLTILYRTPPLYAGKCPVLSCLVPMPLCLMGSAAPDAGVST